MEIPEEKTIFIKDETYSLFFPADGRLFVLDIIFSGRGVTVGGIDYGRFDRIDSKGNEKFYFISKEGYRNMRLKLWEEEREEW